MDDLKQKEKWQYYISSFMSVEPTEGVNRSRLQKTVLARNLPSTDDKLDDSNVPKAISYVEGLVHKVCLNSLKIVYKEGTEECFVYDQTLKDAGERTRRAYLIHRASKKREEKMREKYILNSKWMKDMSQSDVEKIKDDWSKWLNDGVAPSGGEAMDTTE